MCTTMKNRNNILLTARTFPDATMSNMVHLKIVAIGSSAGGLTPTIEFFKQMDPKSGMAFVVIQHLQADKPSLTPKILSRITRMTVTAATDQELALPNRVYTLSPNVQLTIADGRFHVAPRTESSGRHKPFDRFLDSLAIDCGTMATAVVLSGYDGDGSEGFIAIKAHGGITYAQDRSAEIDEMPQHAMDTGCVDYVLAAGKIAERISLHRQ
jgi:two-component system CheB/CheR fusion protein